MSSTTLGKHKRRHKDRSTGPAAAPAGGVSRRPKASRHWLRWAIAAALCAGAGFATYALVENVFWPRIPSALVGKWQVQGGPQDGVTLEFWANGAFEARARLNGKEGVVHARAELEDKVLRIVSTNQQTGQSVTKIHIIKSLTEHELIMEDPAGVVSQFVRVE
jgi:uncharacterized protein (TIGR03066 family)